MSKSEFQTMKMFLEFKVQIKWGKSILKRKNNQVVNSSTVNFLFKFSYKLDILMKQSSSKGSVQCGLQTTFYKGMCMFTMLIRNTTNISKNKMEKFKKTQ